MADATMNGALGGAASGASMGSVAGPWGTAIGAVAGGIIGGVQGGELEAKKREAEKLAKAIPLVDPDTQKYLDDMRFRRRALEAGTSSLFNPARRSIEQAQAQTNANLARTTGGSTGTLIDALLRGQTRTNTAMAQVGGEQRALANQFFMAEQPILAGMADRRLRLQSYNRDLAAMQAATMQQSQQMNTNAALATLPNLVKNNQAPMWAQSAMQRDAQQAIEPMKTIGVQRDPLTYQPVSAPAYAAAAQTPYVPPPNGDMGDPNTMFNWYGTGKYGQ